MPLVNEAASLRMVLTNGPLQWGFTILISRHVFPCTHSDAQIQQCYIKRRSSERCRYLFLRSVMLPSAMAVLVMTSYFMFSDGYKNTYMCLMQSTFSLLKEKLSFSKGHPPFRSVRLTPAGQNSRMCAHTLTCQFIPN